MPGVDKNFVKNQFNKSFKSYNTEASVQKAMAKKLVSELCLVTNKLLSNIFEIGSGTGILTQNIIENLKFDHLIANDIAPNSIQKIKNLESTFNKPIEFIEGDVEKIKLPNQLDLLISNATLQWLNNIPEFFIKANQSINSGGFLAFSTFGCDNFKEIKTLTGIGLDYLSLNKLVELLANDFNILLSEEWIEIKEFNTPFEVLAHIRQTGVNGINKKPLSKKQMDKFLTDYHLQFSTENKKVTLTYNPIIIIAQKK